MSNPRKIEELTEATNLQDNDLMFASVLNSGNAYVSKKVTLASIANYIRNNSGEIPSQPTTHSGPCGYEMIDTSEDSAGVYTSETISTYTSNSSKNYLWTLSVGSATGAVTSLEKTVSKDCLVWISGITPNVVKIDNIELKMKCFWSSSANNYRFYLKSGQKLFVGSPTSGNIYVSIIPLKSGGKFYFDTSKPDKFYSGIVGPVNSPQTVANGDTNIFPGQAYMNNQSNKPTITVDCPTMFACTYWAMANVTSSNDLLNGKKTWSDDVSSRIDSNAPSFFILDAGDTLTPLTSNPAQDQIQLDWIAYPLLMEEESGSGSNSGSCSYGYEIYDMSESNPSNDYFYNKVAVLNGTQDTFEHTFSQDCEIVLKTIGIGSILNSYLDAFVKIDDIPINIGLLTNGEWGGYESYSGCCWKMTTLFVKAGQKLSINRRGNYSLGTYDYIPEKIVLHSRPLKQGGDFFIDTDVPLEEPFTSWGNTISRFEAPRKTLFAWASVRSATASLADNLATMNIKPRLNGLQIYPHVRPGNPDDSTMAQNDWSYSLYDRLVLDAGDILTFELNVRYCAYPLT